LNSVELVFDGGDENNPPLVKPVPKKPVLKKTVVKEPVVKKPVVKKSVVKKPWTSARISAGELFVADTKRGHLGLVYHDTDGEPAFIRVPRKAALSMTGMGESKVASAYCESLGHAEKAQRSSLVRSQGKQIYSDNKMCNPGVQLGRAAKGVWDASYHKQSMPARNWDNIVQTMVKTENVMSSFVPTSELRRLNFAQQLIGYKTMRATCDDLIILPCKIFGALAFAKNVHLSCHRDDDFAKSVVTVHKNGHGYNMSDSIVAYFLGMVVPGPRAWSEDRGWASRYSLQFHGGY